MPEQRPSIWEGIDRTIDLPENDPICKQWEELADELIKEARESEILTAEDYAVTINARAD